MIILIISLLVLLIIVGYTVLLFGFGKLFLINSLLTMSVIIYVNFRFKKHVERGEKVNFLFSFIELFILNYDVQKSIDGALSVVVPLLDAKAQKLFAKLGKDGDGTMLLQNLRSYFSHHYYESFIDIVNVVTTRGGEIMKASEVLLYSISQSEARILKLQRIDTAYLIKFTFSWVFIMIIGVVFRFALNGFLNFNDIPFIYIVGNEAFIAVFLVSFILVIENTIRSGKRDY